MLLHILLWILFVPLPPFKGARPNLPIYLPLLCSPLRKEILRSPHMLFPQIIAMNWVSLDHPTSRSGLW